MISEADGVGDYSALAGLHGWVEQHFSIHIFSALFPFSDSQIPLN